MKKVLRLIFQWNTLQNKGGYTMDFKVYAKQKRLEAHKGIITDICMTVNHCANCHNDETGKTDCLPLYCVDLHKVTADSFYMESFDNSRTNRELLDIASQNGYEAWFIKEDNVIMIKFWKK